MIIGTNHFKDKHSAIIYYSTYMSDNLNNFVEEKIKNGEIVIGKPEIKEGQKLLLNKEEGRYFIEENS